MFELLVLLDEVRKACNDTANPKLINDLISKHRALLLDELKKVDLDLKQAYKLYITDKYKLPVEALT